MRKVCRPFSISFCSGGFVIASIACYFGYLPGSALGLAVSLVGLTLSYVGSRCEARDRRVRAVADKLLYGGPVPENWSRGILMVPKGWSMEQIREFQQRWDALHRTSA